MAFGQNVEHFGIGRCFGNEMVGSDITEACSADAQRYGDRHVEQRCARSTGTQQAKNVPTQGGECGESAQETHRQADGEIGPNALSCKSQDYELTQSFKDEKGSVRTRSLNAIGVVRRRCVAHTRGTSKDRQGLHLRHG